MKGKISSVISSNGNSDTFRPQLTSLIDVMTILLVFLIKSFDVEGNLVTPSPDLVLPISSSKKPPKPTTSIEITRDAIVAEGKTLVFIKDVGESDSLLVPGIFEWLKEKKTLFADSTKVGEVMIQSDQDIEFNIIKKVMYSCSKAGFSDFTILVMEEG